MSQGCLIIKKSAIKTIYFFSIINVNILNKTTCVLNTENEVQNTKKEMFDNNDNISNQTVHCLY
jgi:hypothetical protein